MLRYGNKIIKNTEDLSIDLKGRIYNVKTGETIKTYICRGREIYKGGYKVHIIQVSTNSNAYFEGCHVHHCDENPLNNALSNLVTLTKAEHRRIHKTFLLHVETRKKISDAQKGKPKSYATKQNISVAHKGKKLSDEHRKNIGKATSERKWWNNGVENRYCKECPEGFVSGLLKKKKEE